MVVILLIILSLYFSCVVADLQKGVYSMKNPSSIDVLWTETALESQIKLGQQFRKSQSHIFIT